MKPTFKFARLAMVAAPLTLAAGMGSAGGLAPPVEIVTPTPVAPPPMMRSTDWTGFYVGGQLGYGDIDVDDDFFELDGAIYGVHVGYMYDFGTIVLGAEFDYDLTAIDASFDDFDDDPFTVEVDSIMRLKLRVGYDAGAFLPYITGGVVRATLSVEGPVGSADFEADGDFYGIGAAYKFSDSILIGGEVLQHKFYEGDIEPGEGFDATTATARVSFKF